MSIGAGDLDVPIRAVLSRLADNNAELPPELIGDLQRWLRGYEGTDTEPVLRGFIGRLRMATTDVPRATPIPPRLATERAFKHPMRTTKTLMHR